MINIFKCPRCKNKLTLQDKFRLTNKDEVSCSNCSNRIRIIKFFDFMALSISIFQVPFSFYYALVLTDSFLFSIVSVFFAGLLFAGLLLMVSPIESIAQT